MTLTSARYYEITLIMMLRRQILRKLYAAI